MARKDTNQLAFSVVQQATGEVVTSKKTIARRKAGQIGGAARSKVMSPEERADFARLGAMARWKKTPPKD